MSISLAISGVKCSVSDRGICCGELRNMITGVVDEMSMLGGDRVAESIRIEVVTIESPA